MILKRQLGIMGLMFLPITPHIAEEMWEKLGHPTSLADVKWPAYREDLTREEQVEVIIQINGRLRGKMLVDEGFSEDETVAQARNDPRISVLIAGKEMVKIVVVLRKLVNFVLR